MSGFVVSWGENMKNHQYDLLKGEMHIVIIYYFHIASCCVQVHNDPGCSSAPYTCQRSVSLFLPWDGEVRLHATNVTFKGQRSALSRVDNRTFSWTSELLLFFISGFIIYFSLSKAARSLYVLFNMNEIYILFYLYIER